MGSLQIDLNQTKFNLNQFLAFFHMGSLHAVPRQLLHHDPHGLHLAHSLSRRLEVQQVHKQSIEKQQTIKQIDISLSIIKQ